MSTWKNNIYIANVLGVQPSNLLAYYPCDEKAGANILFDRSANARHGTPQSSTLPTLGSSGIGDGTNAINFASTSYINLFNSGLGTAINGAEGSISFWFQINSVIQTDGLSHYLFFMNIDASNQLWFRKQTTNNQFAFTHLGGGTAKSAAWTTTTTGWQHVVFTWSVTAGLVKIWLNGEPGAGPSPGIGTLTGTPVTFLLGATTTGGSSSWRGKLAHLGVWSKALSVGDVGVLARKSGQVIFDGDSRTKGTTSPYPTQTMALAEMLARNYAWYNSGTSGETVTQITSNAATEVDANYKVSLPKNICVVWGGVNDGNAGADMNTIYNRLVTYCQARRTAGFKVVICTEIDSQSVQSQAVSWSSNYGQLNTLIRNNWSTFADALADLGNNANLQNAANTTYFLDGTHLTDTGYGVVAGIVKDALLTL